MLIGPTWLRRNKTIQIFGRHFSGIISVAKDSNGQWSKPGKVLLSDRCSVYFSIVAQQVANMLQIGSHSGCCTVYFVRGIFETTETGGIQKTAAMVV